MTVESGRRVAALSSPTRDELLDAYKAHIKEARANKRLRHKLVILESVRKRPPRLLLKQESATVHQHQHQYQHQHAPRPKKEEVVSENVTRAGQERGNYFTKFLAGQFGLNSEERPEGWAAAKINRAMRRYYRVHLLLTKRDEQHLALQSKLLFEECCRCRPLLLGPTRTESGVLRLAEPNLPKILRILKNQANDGLDLLQPHGLAQYTVMHVAAQRGYTSLMGELITHWNSHPMNSPHQKYSFLLLSHLLELILQLRKTKGLVSESNAEMRALVAEIGVSFAHFSDALDKLHDHAITLQDLLVICGHPLVLSKDAMGNTPLHYAAEGGHLSLCKLLISGGANINAQNKSGETPLHFAISSRRHGVCMHLVENHADVRMSRYVSLALMNGSVIRGTFVDSPEGSATGKLMPSLHYSSGAMVQQQHLHVSNAKTQLPQYKISAGGSSPVSPDIPLTDRAHARHEAVGGASDTAGTMVDALLASPFLCTRNRRDIVFFRPAPGVSLLPPKLLCVLVISEHVTPSEMNKARGLQEKGKLFHLLIQNVPAAAVVAMDSFRTPLFRCSMLKNIREHNQRWIVDSKLKTSQEKHEALLVQMKGQANTGRSPRRRRRRGLIRRAFDRVWASVMEFWAFLRRVRSILSVQHVFAATDAETAHKESIVCEPKGILYEYVYDHAEFRGHLSPTLWLIIQTESKELLFHPWVNQLLYHKWNSFARQTFRSEFHVYFVYFVAVFVATYLHVGDTFVGMPLGGYRNNIFTHQVGYMEYLRDLARLVYSAINAHYTLQEFRAYRDSGSLRAYLRDGWNWFDLLQISCVWLLLVGEIQELVYPDLSSDDFRLIVNQESLYTVNIRRRYNFRITLMSIVGPQIFIKWIQFARGTQLFGPFVRMIAKMFSDILVFVVVFCVFLCGFAFAFFILQLEGCKSYLSAVTTTFNISLGSWDWDAIYEGGSLAILLFVAFTVIGTIMLLNLLIAMMGNTYDKIWEDRLLFFELERAKATLSIQTSLDDDVYDDKHWCQRLYALEGDTPIEGIQFHRF